MPTSRPPISYLLPLTLALLHTALSYDPKSVHVLFLTDCTHYSDWMAAGMAFSFKNSGQPGKITRVMCCTEKEKAHYPHDMLTIMDTHVAPSFAHNEETNDNYPPFNKPGAVLDFMQHGTSEADWMLVIDSHALSADYTYMIGCANALADRHIPEIDPRSDELAGPKGRRCDQVGGWVYMHKDDLSRVAPLWLEYTAWNLTGDQYVEPHGKAWISEMYGYGFACAKSDVWHTWDRGVMHYPTYDPPMSASSKLIHYGLQFDVVTGGPSNYTFDKHDHYQFDVRQCPPWDLTPRKNREEIRGGLFPHAPRVSELLNTEGNHVLYYHNLLSIETIATLNAGFCSFHMDNCDETIQLYEACQETLERYIEVKIAIKEAESTLLGCQDEHVSGHWQPDWPFLMH
eukprot:gene919-5221_t